MSEIYGTYGPECEKLRFKKIGRADRITRRFYGDKMTTWQKVEKKNFLFFSWWKPVGSRFNDYHSMFFKTKE